MFKTLGTVAAFALITSATWFGLGVGSTASAWRTDYDASAYCNDNHTFSFKWRFENTEPAEDKYTMDVTVTEVISGQSVTETVAPGEEISGKFNTDYTSINSWRIKFDTVWTDGRAGSHQFGEAMPGWECQQPEEPKQIEVCRDGVVITINEEDRKSTDTDAPCPTPEQIKVCRDGEVITINEEDRKSTDTDAPCPTPEEKTVEVCRDGKEITVKESEVRDSDLEGDCPEVLGEQTPTVLPNTGASALVSVGLGLATLGSAGYGVIRSRK